MLASLLTLPNQIKNPDDGDEEHDAAEHYVEASHQSFFLAASMTAHAKRIAHDPRP